MQIQLVLLFIVLFSAVPSNSLTLTLSQVGGCTCAMATVQTDCITNFCNWDATTSKCANKTCDQFTQSLCDQLPDYLGCAWKDTSCQAFTKCSDYATDDGFVCFRKGPCQAVFKKNTTGQYPCANKTNPSMHSIDTCTGIDQAGCVETIQDDGKVCYWNASTSVCEGRSNSACSNFDNTSVMACPKFSCDYNATTGKCTTRTCSTITAQASCTMVWDIVQQNATICQWVNNACAEFDYSALPQSTCLAGSSMSYMWNSNSSKCEICAKPQDTTSNGLILMTVLSLAILLL